MEAKKNPRHDVHRLSARFFLVGIIISICLTLVAFEWRTEKKKIVHRQYDRPLEAMLEVKSHTEKPPSPFVQPKKVTAPPVKLKSIPTDIVPDTKTEDDPQPAIDINQPIDYSRSGYVLPPEDSTEIVVFAEVQPKPVGGYDSFYKLIGKNLKYPRQASRQEIEGKVYVEFVVSRNGEPSQIKVIKGIGAGCDEEAMRVVGLSRWEPGRQRGKPVKTKMTLPIHFKIR